MEDVFKKVLYAGAGLAAMAAEKVEATVDELVEKGKISDKEGKKIIEDFFKNTESKKEEFESKLKDVTEDVVSRFDFVGKNKTIKDMAERIEKLEAELNKSAKRSTGTKKTSATA